jgi:hypothetical protein
MLAHHRDNEWTAPGAATESPWQQAQDAKGKSTFEHWVQQDPLQLTRLGKFMQRMPADRSHWIEWLPEDVVFKPEEHDSLPVFVDVGGGRGHDLSALARWCPGRRARLILEDLPSVIQEGDTERQQSEMTLGLRIELVRHGFFLKQPTTNASVYYMHKIIQASPMWNSKMEW